MSRGILYVGADGEHPRLNRLIDFDQYCEDHLLTCGWNVVLFDSLFLSSAPVLYPTPSCRRYKVPSLAEGLTVRSL